MALEPVHEYEQSQPDHVNEVPVPGNGFKREVVVGSEMAFQRAQPNNREHDRADRHVQTVETGEHKEGLAVDAGAQLQATLGVSLVILQSLATYEDETQDEGQCQKDRKHSSVASAQGVMGNGNRNA